MHLTIDASNIRKGGGVTHLREVLGKLDAVDHSIQSIHLWAPRKTLEVLPDHPRINKMEHRLIDAGRLQGEFFRRRILDDRMTPDTDLVWSPGGTYYGSFRPAVTMLRNLLPFDDVARNRYRYSKDWLRLVYLRRQQIASFERATGVIFVSEEARRVVNRSKPLILQEQAVIHHGIGSRFFMSPRPQREAGEFSAENPARVLYVSRLNRYKHHDILVKAVHQLRTQGLHIELNLVGSATPPRRRDFELILSSLDPDRSWVRWHHEVPYEEVQKFYHEADICTFMSSCESFGNILLEAMAAGLPILASNRSAAPEINGGTCPEVDPEDSRAVAVGLRELIENKKAREVCAAAAFARAQTFSWTKCASQTFRFLDSCAKLR